MDEDALNMSIRKFLKKVGINAQRELERAMEQAEQAGGLDGAPVPVRITLECDRLDTPLVIEDELPIPKEFRVELVCSNRVIRQVNPSESGTFSLRRPSS